MKCFDLYVRDEAIFVGGGSSKGCLHERVSYEMPVLVSTTHLIRHFSLIYGFLKRLEFFWLLMVLFGYQ